jgi:hypothetical protein
MPHFIRTFPAPDRQTLDFYFSRTESDSDIYFVSVIDNTLKSILFYMHPADGRWLIQEPERMPKWIRALETELSEAIRNHTRPA